MKHVSKISKQWAVLPLRDHRAIGVKQRLYFLNELSHGSCFFLPRGAHIYNKLVDYLKSQYRQRGYEEVITPNIYDCRLWQASGHWKHYEHNMIKFKLSGDKEYSLKPMNCPGHCLMYKEQQSSITDARLPIRWADFGVLHRNELSGTLSGLTRVRRFQQDDAHIFCRPDQIESEVRGCLQFAQHVYTKFNFDFDIRLSLRPESFMGSLEQWNEAENGLRQALDSAKLNWTEQENEGAFYGPKIDLIVRDTRDRSHQCATIQLDFQLPEKFDLLYKDTSRQNTFKRPVIVHRAILGSMERFIAMVAENCDGRWPFWLSPLQAVIIPIHANLNSYAQEIHDQLRAENFWVDCDLSKDLKLNGKLREALLTRYNLIIIVGNEEANTRTVTCRVVERTIAEEVSPDDEIKPSSDNNLEEKTIGREHDTDLTNTTTLSAPAREEKVVIRNINLSLTKFVDHLRAFNASQVDRADLELLKLVNNERGGGGDND